ncbi:hypothetical protein AB0N81_23635 [Streptomyces sp. NPDC093510]|uniref:hypothetical protein n=1 Tax=Streptomyces sp. NPDC093510 TaxID=3155199 RepID=UPI00341E4F87
MTHSSDLAPDSAPPRVPRPRPRSPEPRLPTRMLPGTDEPPAPAPVRAAFALWLTAVASGVFGTALAVVGETSAASGALRLTGGLLFRMALFSAAVLVAVRMRRGARWARWALTGGLGLLGATALAATRPDRWPTGPRALGEAVADAGAVDVLSGAGLVLQLAAALTATALLFHPAANAWFRATRHR